METTTTIRDCRVCRVPFEAQTFEIMGTIITPHLCEPCVAQWEADNAARTKRPAMETIKDKWGSKATAAGFKRFLRFDATQLVPRSLEAWQDLQSWAGLSSLLFIGATSLGKTFIAVDLARRSYLAGQAVHLVDAIEFGRDMGQPNSERRDAALTDCIACDLLVLDDIGKAQMTPRTAEGLFTIINRRENDEKPVIITTNADSKDLSAKLTEEFAAPLLARIRRMCKVINFSATQ